jgi:hypothetical protein
VAEEDRSADAPLPLTAREVGQLLRDVTLGRRAMVRVHPHTREESPAGLVVIDVDGWSLSIRYDGDALDYCEACESPDGRRWSFDPGNRYGTDPVALLSTWEHGTLQRLLVP